MAAIPPDMTDALLQAAHAFLDAPDHDSLIATIQSRTAAALGAMDARLLRAGGGRDEIFDSISLQLGLAGAGQSPDDLRVFADLAGVARNDDADHPGLAQAVAQLAPGEHAMLAPVSAGDLFIGVLLVCDEEGQRTFSDADEAVLIELARFAGQALRSEEIARDREARDGLTGLWDQAYLRREMLIEADRCQRTHQPLSLVLFDIDHFKRINDTAGHPAGDAVLRQVAAFLNEHSRSHDLAVRYGGEEFAMLMPGADATAAGRAAERLRQAIADVPAGDWAPWQDAVTVSCGVAMLTRDLTGIAREQAVQELISRADEALYASKRGGRNRTTVDWD